MKILPLVLLSLAGCSNLDNMVGFGVSLDTSVTKECIVSTIPNAIEITELNVRNNALSFVTQKYAVEFQYIVKNNLVVSYDITIDGMFIGQSSKIFIQNSYALQKRIHSAIEQKCY